MRPPSTTRRRCPCAARALLAVLCTASVGPPAAAQVAERDLLQSRALTLVLHHATAVANPAQLPASISVASPIPVGLDRQGKFWPAFGAGAAPEMSPLAAGAEAGLAALPQVAAGIPSKEDGASPAYRWRAELAGRQWLVAGYSNYYGPPQRLQASPGVQQVLDLQIRSHYTAAVEDGEHVLRMALELRNSGTRPLRDLQFRLCFTETLAGHADGPTQRLFLASSRSVEGQATYSSAAHADGNGRRAAAGHAATVSAASLLPSETRTFQMVVRGRPAAATAELHPAYLVGLREDPGGERLWPPSVVSGNAPDAPRLYYRQAALLMPAPYRFSLGTAKAEVTAVLPASTN